MNNSMDLYGKALSDSFNKRKKTPFYLLRDDGYKVELPVEYYFSKYEDFSEIEKIALINCKGNILDVGAGTGRHSLYLQEKGFIVDSIDISEKAIDIMKKNGVKNPIMGDIFELKDKKYDTVFMLDHGIGIAGTIEGLENFLKKADSFLNVGGIVIFDSLDIRKTNEKIHLEYQKSNIEQGKYFGEIRLRFEYESEKGTEFHWLQVDKNTLFGICKNLGWRYELLCEQEDGNYLVKILK